MTNTIKSEQPVNKIFPQAAVMQIVSGVGFSLAVKTAVELGVFDAINNGKKTVNAIAESLSLNAPALSRLLKALQSVSLVTHDEDGSYQVTEYGATLLTGKPRSLEPLVKYLLHETVVQSMAEMKYSIQTGRPAFEKVFGEQWYGNHEMKDDYLQTMDKAMEIYSRMSLPALLASYPFDQYDVIVDVAGGLGQLISGVLQSAPESKGVLFDLPDTIERARMNAGMADTGERCAFVSGSMFEQIPSGGSLYMISKVLNDWDDEHVVSILANIRKVMTSGTRLIIIENLPDKEGMSPEEAFRDLLFLVCSEGGSVRTLDELGKLANEAGLDILSVRQTPSKYSIIECAVR
ncbi:methyltransferase [Paenibacillus sp. FSL P4-0338]|uniref:methyltransferase n=1 Tax=unclassified Paenibacillus TaxID=185978 RepID=UPI0003E21876|nr:methyltransferase [Paenibacillus sp. FSL R7-269]ETT37860.1 hydroxyneurosporene-O-methyltransferase [Paenibacillus sp. FSL R7-269]